MSQLKLGVAIWWMSDRRCIAYFLVKFVISQKTFIQFWSIFLCKKIVIPLTKKLNNKKYDDFTLFR